MQALKTTTQLAFCDRSTSKLAKCGIETFGSFVQCTKSVNGREEICLKNLIFEGKKSRKTQEA
jgi:hypothetical protein